MCRGAIHMNPFNNELSISVHVRGSNSFINVLAVHGDYIVSTVGEGGAFVIMGPAGFADNYEVVDGK